MSMVQVDLESIEVLDSQGVGDAERLHGMPALERWERVRSARRKRSN